MRSMLAAGEEGARAAEAGLMHWAAQLELKAKESAAAAQSAGGDTVAPYSRSFQRTLVATITNAPDEGVGLVGSPGAVPVLVIGCHSTALRSADGAPPGAGRPHPAHRRLGADRAGGGRGRVCVPGGQRRVVLRQHPGAPRRCHTRCAPTTGGRAGPSAAPRGQVMVTREVAAAAGGLKALISTGTSVLVEGELTETPPGTKQARRPPRRRRARQAGLPAWRCCPAPAPGLRRGAAAEHEPRCLL